MKTERKHRIVLLQALIAAAVCLCFGVTTCFGWIISYITSSMNIDGSIHGSYFESGDGSQATPYRIATPMQLYYLGWLQNLGYFNNAENGVIATQYFTLTQNIDMTGYVLPSIGTAESPFVGHFDGAGYQISNLTVTNDDLNMTEIPVYTDVYVTYAQIVGFFGVVGSVQGDGLLGTYSYDTSACLVTNFVLNNVIVKTVNPRQSKTLIGLICGYMNAPITNVGVANSEVQVGSSLSSLGSVNDVSLTNRISDYTTVGFCRSEYKEQVKVAYVDMGEPSVTDEDGIAEETGTTWGNSINILSIFNRLQSIESTSYASDASYTAPDNSVTINFRNYYNADAGSFSFHSRNSYGNTFVYLFGEDHYTYTYQNVISKVFKLSYSNTYLLVNSSYSGFSAGSSSNYTTFYYYVSDSYIYCLSGTTKYYLNRSNSTLSISTNPSTTWIFSGNYPMSGSYYIRYRSSTWSCNTSTSYRAASTTISEGTETIEYQQNKSYPSYFPLSALESAPFTVNDNNTGYIIGGANYPSRTAIDASEGGDIRVSKYANDKVYRSLNSSSSTAFSNTNLTMLTRTSTSNGYAKIADDYNNGSSNTALGSQSEYRYDSSQLNLKKYETSRETLKTVFSLDTSYLYGLHFMDAQITSSRLVTAPKVVIAKYPKLDEETDAEYRVRNTFTNYQMPEDSIDFQLREDGSINFFAGTYFSSGSLLNSTFFSLHKIYRSDVAPYNITAIKEISLVYKDPSDEKIYYAFTDGTNSITINDDYTLNSNDIVFDLSWITNPTMVTYAMYYFEIPTAAGEYCLGSVANKHGAYLLYLDISANAQEVHITDTIEIIRKITNTYEYPIGVALINNSTPAANVNELNSISVALESGYSGTLHFDRDTENNVILTGTTTNSSAIYIGDGINAYKNSVSSSNAVSRGYVSQTIELTHIFTHSVYNKFTKVTSNTVTKTVDLTEDGTTTRSITVTTWDDDKNTTHTTVAGEDTDPAVVITMPTVILSYEYVVPEGSIITNDYVYAQERDDNGDAINKTYTIIIDSSTTITVVYSVKDNSYTYIVNGTTLSSINGNVVI